MDPTKMTSEQLKYAQEAAKRTRAEGISQYQDLHLSENDRLRRLVDDPYANHEKLDKLPPPIDSGAHAKFLVLGAGVGGIMAAVRLVKAGFHPNEIVLVDVAGGPGGTWYWNRYPGLHCDVEAYCYLPLLEETGYVPTTKYTSASEIRKYLFQLLDQFRLSERVLYRAQISGLQWEEKKHAWRVDISTSRGPGGMEKDTMWANADFVMLFGGLFPYPHIPKVPGVSGFQGEMFHTSRWDYSVTGGSSDDPFPDMHKLAGKRVAIVGTGATAVQVVPELAKHAKEVYVFQRTPSQVFPRGQRRTDPEEWRSRIARGPGWQKARMENLAEHMSRDHMPDMEDLVDDEWTKLKTYCALVGSRRFGNITREDIPSHIANMTTMDAQDTARIRQRISNAVKDKATATKLMPWYYTWCKRPTFSDTYLETFNEPHVHLIDTDGAGVESLGAHHITANGTHYPIDILIWGTGYRSPGVANADPASRPGITVLGRNKQSLSEKVARKGASGFHGICTNGFPNLFWAGVSQVAATANFTHTLDLLSAHMTFIVTEACRRNAVDGLARRVVIEAEEAAEDAYAMRIMGLSPYYATIALCTPGYLSLEGEAARRSADLTEAMKAARGGGWSLGINSFAQMLESWRADGKLKGIRVKSVGLAKL